MTFRGYTKDSITTIADINPSLSAANTEAAPRAGALHEATL